MTDAYNDKNLLALFEEGLSYAEIAAQLNVTRSMIAGRMKRIREGKTTRAVRYNKPGRLAPAPEQPAPPPAVPVPKPNRHTVQLNPRNHKAMSKAEMQAMLKKAVENT